MSISRDFICQALQCIELFGKGVKVAHAARDGYLLVQDGELSTSEKVKKAGANAFVIITHSVELGLYVKRDVSFEAKLGSQIASGTAIVGKQIVYEGVNKNIWHTIARESLSVGMAISLEHPSPIGDFVVTSGNVLVLGFENELLRRASIVACESIERIVRSIKDILRREQAPAEGQVRELSPEEMDWVRSDMEELEYLARWQELEEIPEAYQNSPEFCERVCYMTGEAIRYLLKLNREEGLALFFERRAVEEWIWERPDEVPEGWPEDLFSPPMRMEYFTSDEEIQNIIDRRLEEFAAEAGNALEELRELYPFLAFHAE